MLWICSQHSLLPVKHSCVMTACAEYSMRVACCRGSRERRRETDTYGEICSSEAQSHLLFMTHRKSFSLSSRWYPGSKHNMQPSEHKSAWPVTYSEMRRGQQGACCWMCSQFDVIWVSFLFFFIPPSSTSVRLTAPPKFTNIPTDQIGVSGGVASFVCQANGNPKPVVYWNKKGKKVNSQRIEVVVTVHNVQLLL